MTIRVEAVSDLHGRWGPRDLSQLAGCRYDLLLFTGDPGGARLRDGLAVCRSIGRVVAPSVVVRGNPDRPSLVQLAAEVFGHPRRSDRSVRRLGARLDRLQCAISPVRLGG